MCQMDGGRARAVGRLRGLDLGLGVSSWSIEQVVRTFAGYDKEYQAAGFADVFLHQGLHTFNVVLIFTLSDASDYT